MVFAENGLQACWFYFPGDATTLQKTRFPVQEMNEEQPNLARTEGESSMCAGSRQVFNAKHNLGIS